MKSKYTVLTMGNFDGVHLGHQKLLKEVVYRAKKKNGNSIVLTYCKHPLETLNVITFPYLLTKTEHKEQLIKDIGVDKIEYMNFNSEMAKLDPKAFLKRFIIDKYNPDEIVFGYDTHFGKDRSGDFKLLKNFEKKYNYFADLVEPFKFDNKIIGSTFIRKLLKNGKIKNANKLLSRNYSIFGNVEKGKKIGRKLGFPTINISTKNKYKLLPKNGVYFTKIYIAGKKYFSITNVGVAPTIKDLEKKIVETFVFDFSAEVYDKTIKLEFLEFVREEKRFSDKEELVKNIHNDIDFVKERIKNEEANF